jgi:hypothetical protein
MEQKHTNLGRDIPRGPDVKRMDVDASPCGNEAERRASLRKVMKKIEPHILDASENSQLDTPTAISD